jgi:hypothetical protein
LRSQFTEILRIPMSGAVSFLRHQPVRWPARCVMRRAVRWPPRWMFEQLPAG